MTLNVTLTVTLNVTLDLSNERQRINIKVERGSTLRLRTDFDTLSLFYLHTEKLRDSSNSRQDVV